MAESLFVGLQALRANPLRAVLSTLGVIFGVAALVSVLALGDGLEEYGRSQVSGTTDLQVIVVAPQVLQVVDGQVVPRLDYPAFTASDVGTLASRLRGHAQVTLWAHSTAVISLEGGSNPDRTARVHAAAVVATLPSTQRALGFSLAAGRFLSDSDLAVKAHVAVFSSQVAQTLAPGVPSTSLLGVIALLQGVPYRVVGVLAEDSTAPAGVYLPLGAAPPSVGVARGEGLPGVPQLIVIADSIEQVSPIRTNIEDWLTTRLGRWRGQVDVRSEEGRVAQVRQGILIFKIAMGALTGISLVVGGIGIMNVLLATVTERTREIGIRRAAGAQARDILMQFLSESVAITAVGSFLGAGLGLAAAFGVTWWMRTRTHAPVYAAFSWGTLLVASAAATVVGIVFGLYPAIRASRLVPIDAIRHEL